MNLGAGWEVYDVAFKPVQKELRIYIRTVFPCPSFVDLHYPWETTNNQKRATLAV